MHPELIHLTLLTRNNKTNGSVDYLQLYSIVAADALLKIAMAII
jgi:hypothetical protein